MSWWGKYVGLPFTQANCWGLVRVIFGDELGVRLPEFGDASARYMAACARLRLRQGSSAELRAAQAAVAQEIAAGQGAECWTDVAAPRAFDVALMTAGADNRVRHVGVMIDEARLIHSEAGAGACLVGLTDPVIRHRLRGFRRHEACA
ncbi:hypothetical protein DDZ14_08545 [Maritimibacter sp. 55A14]|uniref:NlpC/P60 family protein n=1 Tax=Maritimibacter sp. 55A14 TaxID=2174844 RepID=UPI000D622807|nr:NlpC/P60 family protein [Maritimibacter sp. 55A14]PWE32785.1 hypothetical protein DDZ14_08545 [Maritimibacter sp. 55A14]